MIFPDCPKCGASRNRLQVSYHRKDYVPKECKCDHIPVEFYIKDDTRIKMTVIKEHLSVLCTLCKFAEAFPTKDTTND